jgi:hypothetical protein
MNNASLVLAFELSNGGKVRLIEVRFAELGCET